MSPYAYLERGRYAEQLVPWLETFPGLVRVQFLEDLVADPDVIGELYGWLGVDPTFRPDDPGPAGARVATSTADAAGRRT